MANWIVVFALSSVTVFAQSTLPNASSGAAQEVTSMHNFRPGSETAARKHDHTFKSNRLVRIDQSAGWARAQDTHFADGGTVDQTYGK